MKVQNRTLVFLTSNGTLSIFCYSPKQNCCYREEKPPISSVVYDMMVRPDEYIGKKIRVSGSMATYYDDEPVTVMGTYDIYEDGGYQYCVLKNAVLE